MPPAAILGLGYERDKAVGAVEYIEPAEVWAFVPADHESEYNEAISRANEPLMDTLSPSRVWPYYLYQPYDCFKKLESLTYGTLLISPTRDAPVRPETLYAQLSPRSSSSSSGCRLEVQFRRL